MWILVNLVPGGDAGAQSASAYVDDSAVGGAAVLRDV